MEEADLLADVAFTSVGHLGHVAEVVVNDVDRHSYGNYLYGAFGRDFEPSDGKRVMVAALSPRQWSALVEATGAGPGLAEVATKGGWDFTEDGDRFRAREEIAEVLAPWFASRRIDDVERLLEDAGVLWGRYRTFRELVKSDERVDPGVNPVWRLLDQPGIGRYPAAGPTASIGFAGNQQVIRAIHERLGDDLKHSSVVGGTHWDTDRSDSAPMPGPKREFFFAPARVQVRIKDWGMAELQKRLAAAWARFLPLADRLLTVEHVDGLDAGIDVYATVLNGQASPSSAHVIRP